MLEFSVCYWCHHENIFIIQVVLLFLGYQSCCLAEPHRVLQLAQVSALVRSSWLCQLSLSVMFALNSVLRRFKSVLTARSSRRVCRSRPEVLQHNRRSREELWSSSIYVMIKEFLCFSFLTDFWQLCIFRSLRWNLITIYCLLLLQQIV